MRKRVQATRIILAAAVILAFVAGPGLADWGPTEISFTCYSGNRDDNNYLGTINAFDTVKASSHCNMAYYDCYGRCTACYQSEDSREICVDNSGQPYYY